MTAGDLYAQIEREMREHPDRRPVEVRLRDLGGDMTPILCARLPGRQQPTHEDIDAVVIFVEFLRRAKRVPGGGSAP